MIAEAMIEAARNVSSPDERLKALEECVRAVVLRSFHESGAFGSVALTAWHGVGVGHGAGAVSAAGAGPGANPGAGREAGRELEFVLIDKKGYAPERWLFKARRYLRFSGLEARIAFGRKGNIHSGWVRARVDTGEELGVRLTIDASHVYSAEGGGFEVRIVESGGELFGIRVRAGDAGTGEDAI